jgi:hypothetical protein
MLAVLLSVLTAAAAPPWFDIAGAERMVASGLPEYYAFIHQAAERDPERYKEKLHQGMMMMLSGEQNPQVLAAWQAKFEAEQAYRATLTRWRQAPLSQRAPVRAELLERSEDIEDARIALLQVKQPLTAQRLEHIEADIADIGMNLEGYALQRVMTSLNE